MKALRLSIIFLVLLTLSPALSSAAPPSFTAVDLGTLGGTMSAAEAVSDSGQVLGWSATADGDQHAFSWTRQTSMVDLGTLGVHGSIARAVNARGEVVGDSAVTSEGFGRAFFWTEKTGMVDLGTLGGTSSIATAVNASGLVVGQSTTADGEVHATLWVPAHAAE
jgi:probable HAF family extracellular repeat protein